MSLLRSYRPRLIGRTLTGEIVSGTNIELQAFSDRAADVAAALADEGIECAWADENGLRSDDGDIAKIRFQDQFPFELTVRSADLPGDTSPGES